MENLPNELVHRILLILVEGRAYPNFIHSHWFLHVPIYLEKSESDKLFGQNLQNPLHNISVVNRRLRRIALPLIFEFVDFSVGVNIFNSDKAGIEPILVQNAYFVDSIRYARLSHRDVYNVYDPHKNNQLIKDILKACPKLEYIDINPTTFNATNWNWGSPVPIIEAIRKHPSPTLRMIYPNALGFRSCKIGNKLSDSENTLSPGSLSRISCFQYKLSGLPQRQPMLSKPIEYFHDLIQKLGLRVLHLQLHSRLWGDEVDDSVLHSLYKMTYPDLVSAHGWKGRQSLMQLPSIEDFSDFLDRHPLLRRLNLAQGFPQAVTPWGMRLLNDISPHMCEILEMSIQFSPHSESRCFVSIARDPLPSTPWKLTSVNLELKIDDSVDAQVDPHGRKNAVVDLMVKLGKALPWLTKFEFHFDARTHRIIEELELGTNTILTLLSNFPTVKELSIPNTMSQCIIQQWCLSSSEAKKYGFRDTKTFTQVKPFCEKFVVNLVTRGNSGNETASNSQQMPLLKFVKFSNWAGAGLDIHAHIHRKGLKVEVLCSTTLPGLKIPAPLNEWLEGEQK
ncbi:hypothetical protein VKT23_011569 [Stygiomarasmius scandens]|uniref:F-box domain-containing protein n=1 Tax=Marasmiellus scandens TaxID=2682957 RepID=A0ABR1J8L1_9AGAR